MTDTPTTHARARDALFIEHAEGCSYLRGGVRPPECNCGATVRRQLELQQQMRRESSAPKRDVRYVTIEPGRISLHGIALTDGEYAVLRGIAERMKVAITETRCRRCGHAIHDGSCVNVHPSLDPMGALEC